MANYAFGGSPVSGTLKRVRVIPQIAPPSPPHLAVSRKPGPSIRGVPVRVGGQSGSWDAPLLIRRAPLAYEIGTRQGNVGSVLTKNMIAKLTVVSQVAGSSPDLLPVGPRLQEDAYPLIPITQNSSDINTAPDISAFDCLGVIVQEFPDSGYGEPQVFTVTSDSGYNMGLAMDLGTITMAGLRVIGGVFGNSGDTDYYKFRVPQTGLYQISMPTGIKAYFSVRDSSYNMLGSINDSGPLVKSQQLTAGVDYYVDASNPFGSGYPSSCEFTIKPVTQPRYYYKFAAQQPGIYSFSLSSDDGSAYVELGIRDLSGSTNYSVVKQGTVPSSSFSSSIRAAGDWYIYMQTYSNAYSRLSLKASFLQKAGNYAAVAGNLGTLSTSIVFTVSDTSGCNQWFKFTTNSTGGTRTFSRVTTASMTSYVYHYMTLYAGNGSTQLYSTQNASFSYNLSANTSYYIQVNSYVSYTSQPLVVGHTVTIA